MFNAILCFWTFLFNVPHTVVASVLLYTLIFISNVCLISSLIYFKQNFVILLVITKMGWNENKIERVWYTIKGMYVKIYVDAITASKIKRSRKIINKKTKNSFPLFSINIFHVNSLNPHSVWLGSFQIIPPSTVATTTTLKRRTKEHKIKLSLFKQCSVMKLYLSLLVDAMFKKGSYFHSHFMTVTLATAKWWVTIEQQQ